MYSHIDSVGSVMFVERSSRHQETHAKKSTKSSKLSLYHFLEFLSTRVLDTHKGYLNPPLRGLALSRFYRRVNQRAT